VRRRAMPMGDPEDAHPERDQYRAFRYSLLGYGHRRIRSHERIHCRTLYALVPIWRLLYIVSLPWPHLETSPSLGMGHGDPGPIETNAGIPDPKDLHNPQVEIVCRKYLELRYRLLPYLYSLAREGTLTGLPVMRALWLHYPEDATAVARGDEYLWGPSIL